jgi:hypothetical protein
MVGTQQVGEDARPSRVGYSFAAVSILMLVKFQLKNAYLLGVNLYQPT